MLNCPGPLVNVAQQLEIVRVEISVVIDCLWLYGVTSSSASFLAMSETQRSCGEAQRMFRGQEINS